jgi:hypothetical protein
MPTAINIRNEVNQYLDDTDDCILKIVHNILKTDGEEDFWYELPINVQENIQTAIKQSEEGKGKSHKEVMAKYGIMFEIIWFLFAYKKLFMIR